jgi:hypothetical protein
VHPLHGGEAAQGVEDFASAARIYILRGEAGPSGIDLARVGVGVGVGVRARARARVGVGAGARARVGGACGIDRLDDVREDRVDVVQRLAWLGLGLGVGVG